MKAVKKDAKAMTKWETFVAIVDGIALIGIVFFAIFAGLSRFSWPSKPRN